MIKAQNIIRQIGNKQVLNIPNIEIKKGQALVVMGPSGSGKTTLLRTLAMLDTPDHGQITINNRQTASPSALENPYPTITVVYQQLFLWPHLTNRQNITLAVKNTNYEKKLNELIEYLDMERFIDNYPNQSSVGQKQRVAIARALILNPEYIFFDEITSALDSKQMQSVIQILNDLKTKNIGIFLITHHDQVAEQVADEVLHLDHINQIAASYTSLDC